MARQACHQVHLATSQEERPRTPISTIALLLDLTTETLELTTIKLNHLVPRNMLILLLKLSFIQD